MGRDFEALLNYLREQKRVAGELPEKAAAALESLKNKGAFRFSKTDYETIEKASKIIFSDGDPQVSSLEAKKAKEELGLGINFLSDLRNKIMKELNINPIDWLNKGSLLQYYWFSLGKEWAMSGHRFTALGERDQEIYRLLHGRGDDYRYTVEEVAQIFRETPAEIRAAEARVRARRQAGSHLDQPSGWERFFSWQEDFFIIL